MPPKLSWVNLYCHLLHSLQHQSQYKLFTFPKLLKQHPISTCGTLQWFALKSKQVIVPWDPQMRFTAPFLSCPTQSHFWSAYWWILSPSCMTEQSPVLFSAIIVWGLNLFIFVFSCISRAPLQKLKPLNLHLFPIDEKIECVELKRR